MTLYRDEKEMKRDKIELEEERKERRKREVLYSFALLCISTRKYGLIPPNIRQKHTAMKREASGGN